MATYVEHPEDLCTDAIPDPPRGQQKPKAQPEVPREDKSKGAKPPEAKQNNQKKSYSDEPSKGFTNYPNGSIIIQQSVGPIHIGNNVTQTQHIYTESKYPMGHMGTSARTRDIPETDKIRAMFANQDLVTDKDLRYLKKYISIVNFGDTASELGFEDEEIERHKYDPNNYQQPEEIIYRVLREWKQNRCEKEHGYDPTIGKLAKTLWDTGSKLAVHNWAGKVIK